MQGVTLTVRHLKFALRSFKKIFLVLTNIYLPSVNFSVSSLTVRRPRTGLSAPWTQSS